MDPFTILIPIGIISFMLCIKLGYDLYNYKLFVSSLVYNLAFKIEILNKEGEVIGKAYAYHNHDKVNFTFPPNIVAIVRVTLWNEYSFDAEILDSGLLTKFTVNYTKKGVVSNLDIHSNGPARVEKNEIARRKF